MRTFRKKLKIEIVSDNSALKVNVLAPSTLLMVCTDVGLCANLTAEQEWASWLMVNSNA